LGVVIAWLFPGGWLNLELLIAVAASGILPIVTISETPDHRSLSIGKL
jgi:hypothetical protein